MRYSSYANTHDGIAAATHLLGIQLQLQIQTHTQIQTHIQSQSCQPEPLLPSAVGLVLHLVAMHAPLELQVPSP